MQKTSRFDLTFNLIRVSTAITLKVLENFFISLQCGLSSVKNNDSDEILRG